MIKQDGPKGAATVIGTAIGIHKNNHAGIIGRIADNLIIPRDSIALEYEGHRRPQLLMAGRMIPEADC